MNILSNRTKSALRFYLLRPSIIFLLALVTALVATITQQIKNYNINISNPVPIKHQPLITNLPREERLNTKRMNDFAFVLTTPLFHKTREPFAEKKTADKTFEQLLLTGVLITGEKSFAIFKDTNEKKEKQLPIGAVFGTWKLEHISPLGVRWRSATSEKFIPLQKN